MSSEGEVGEAQFKTAFCPEYEELLVQSHECLEKWEALRQQAWNMGLRGRELGGDLIRLQSEFAKVYSTLQKHIRECRLCAFVANVGKQNIRNRFPIASRFSRPA
ncbi:MAG TPA: hypothetical protein VMJ35_00970 [Dongiaceae bacterium]|nr:hypothetical protein [Dongiaceae bacterium]